MCATHPVRWSPPSVGPGTTRADTGEDTGPVADAMIARILSENGGAAR